MTHTHHSRRTLTISAVLAFLLFASGIGGLGLSRSVAADDTPAKLKVLTTFTILQDIAQNVGGDKVDVESITRPGAEIHDYEPAPDDIVKAQSADLVLVNGLGLERWFDKFFSQVKDVPSVVVSDGVEPIEISGGEYDGKPNPHAWMSPKNGLIYVENIRKALVALDPANADTYNANAAAYSATLMGIDTTLKSELSTLPENQRALVTCEGAFSYLARDFGLKEVYLWEINAENEGTPQQIAKVIDTVTGDQIPAVFCESTVNADAQHEVAAETGARFGGSLYVDSLTEADGDAPTYLKLLEYDAVTIVTGLTGHAPDAATAAA
ncbi:MAG: metal ABC transporter substrate-binding protein [Thermomicrobiales bacterium]